MKNLLTDKLTLKIAVILIAVGCMTSCQTRRDSGVSITMGRVNSISSPDVALDGKVTYGNSGAWNATPNDVNGLMPGTALESGSTNVTQWRFDANLSVANSETRPHKVGGTYRGPDKDGIGRQGMSNNETAAGSSTVDESKRSDKRVPLALELPLPLFNGTPKNIRSANLEHSGSRHDQPATWHHSRVIKKKDHRDIAIEKMNWQKIGLSDEVWIIEKYALHKPVRGEKYPTQGELRTKIDDEEVSLPLKHTDVKAQISAFVASVNVTQKYHNPYDVKIEAEYVFPLPQDAAVTDFVMVIGDRRIRGMVRERKEAEKLYKQAKQQGYRAALLTQERPNIFTQKVANIEPKKQIDIEITYFNPLSYKDNEYEFVFPMVVGPRYNPPGSTDGIGAVARGKRGASGQKMEIEYLKEGKRSGHDISVSVHVDAGISLEKVYSRSHVINVTHISDNSVKVNLADNDRIPNKDFILRFQVAGNRMKTAMMVHKGRKGNTFALVLQPPENLNDSPRMPREMVFVLDCSGSMNGKPMAKSKSAIKRCLRNLDANDTFQIIRFSDNASKWGDKPVPATPQNIKKALKFVDGLHGSGGTRMLEGIKAALDFPHDDNRLRVVSFMTDGYIGNEAEILAAISQRLGSTRIFSFGIGNSVNRYLIERMASFGKGAVAYVGLDESAGEKVDQFYDRLAHPALTDVEIDWGDMHVSDIYPKNIPDVFVGRPIMITGRFNGDGKQTIKIKGRSGTKNVAYPIQVDLDNEENEHSAITKIWARWKIRDLSNLEIFRPAPVWKEQILNTSLEYQLLCKYSAFLAIDSLERTSGDHGVSVKVPAHIPDGVRYETTVSE